MAPNGSSKERGRRNRSVASKSYNAIKAQLVSLNLEIEDQKSAGDLLRAALAREEEAGSHLGEQVAAPDREETERRSREHKEDLARMLERLDQLLTTKKQLGEDARVLIAQVKAEEAATATSIKNLRLVAHEELETAKVTWGAGEASRREKWMSQKTLEMREMTVRGLEPEIERLMDKHKADSENLEQERHLETQRLRQRLLARREDLISAERSRVSGLADDQMQKDRHAAASTKQGLVEEAEGQLQRLRKRLAEELEQQRTWQDEELRRLEMTAERDVIRKREEHAERLQQRRKKHTEKVEAAKRQLAKSLEAVDNHAQEERETWEARARAEHKSRARAEEDKAARREGETMRVLRDKQIDAAIRELHAERQAGERASKAAAAAEVAQLREKHSREVEEVHRKQEQWRRGCRHGTAALDLEVMERLQETKRALLVRQREVEAGVAHLRAKADEVNERQEREQDKGTAREAALVSEHTDLMRSLLERRQELEARVERAERGIRDGEATHRTALDKATEEHESILEALQTGVQRRVAEIDAQMGDLKDALYTETLRADSGTRMLKQYGQVQVEGQ